MSSKSAVAFYKFFIFLGFSILSVFSPLFSDTLKDAKKAYSSKQFQKATKLFLEHAKKSPSDGEPYMYIGYMLESQKQYDTSIAYFRKAVELNLAAKSKKTCLLKIIIFYNYHRSWDMVAHYSNRYLKMESNPEIQKMRDKAYANKGSDPGKIASTTSTTPSNQSEKNSSSKSKEKERTKEKEKDKAKEKEAEKVVEKPKTKEKEKTAQKKTEKEIIESIHKEPSSKENKIWEKALKFMDKEEYKSADAELDTLVSMSPENKNYLYKSGIAKMKLGDYSKALELLESARKLASEKESTFLYYISLNQGNIYLKTAKLSLAEDLFKRACTYKKSPVALLAISKIRFDKFDYESAQENAAAVLKLESKNIDALMYHGISLVKLGKRLDGFSSLMKFSTLLRKQYKNTKLIPVKYHDGLLYLGVFYTNRAKYKLALKYLNLVNNTKKDELSYHFHLGKTLFYTKKYDQALQSLHQVSEIPAANYLIARYYALQKNFEKTKEYFLKASKGKEIYWVKARLDPVFREYMQNPEFQDFITYRGESPTPEPSPQPEKKEPIEEKPHTDPPPSDTNPEEKKQP